MLLRYSSILLSLILFASCAQIIPPTGGPKDAEKPEVVFSVPSNGTIQFRARKIVLFFNEYISLKNPQNIIISPPLSTKPDLNVKKKSLEIVFNEDLIPNTTYQITLSEMISDISEGNTIPLLTYNFSTGDHIDSAYFSGNVINAYTGESISGITIALYTERPDTALLQTVPRYVSRSFEHGRFVLEHLSEGKYFLVAYKDDNNNLKSDKNELFGFYDSSIHTTTKDLRTPLIMSQMRYKEHEYLTDCHKIAANKSLVYNKDPNKILELNKSFSSSHFFSTGTRKDSAFIYHFLSRVPLQDSFVLCKDTSKKSVVIDVLSDLTFVRTIDTLEFLAADNRIVDIEKISILEDSISLNPREILQNDLRFYYPWKTEKKYTITFDSAAITDSSLKYFNTKISFSFPVIKQDQTADLHFIIQNDHRLPLLYELIATEKGNTVLSGTTGETKKISALQLKPGKYLVKLVHDKNKNGSFDEGNFLSFSLPETVYFSDNIDLKPNWEVADVVISFKD